MLKITVPAAELFDEVKREFVYTEEQTLELEHSLVSLSKWESKWCKPFITRSEKTIEETIDYIKCMTLTPDVKPITYELLSDKELSKIMDYINEPMTATTFYDDKSSKSNRETITSEVIYHWMIALNIPFECKDWHLNRLIAQIRLCNNKNQPPKKMSTRAIMERNAALNAERRKKYNTKG